MREIGLVGSLPGVLAGTVGVERWRSALLAAGLPLDLEDLPPGEGDAVAFRVLLADLLAGVERLRAVEAERDAWAEPRRFVVGDVPPAAWLATLGVPAAAFVLAGACPAMTAAGILLAGIAVVGQATWTAREGRRRTRLSAAQAAHAAERAALLRTLDTLYGRPWDVRLGDARWVLSPGEVEVARAAKAGATVTVPA